MKTRIGFLILAITLSFAPLYASNADKSCDMKEGGCCKAASCCTKDATCCTADAKCCSATCSQEHACKHEDAKNACAKACGKECKKPAKTS